MAADTPSATTITDLQRQLVLAQVRILELEDIRDDDNTRITELNALLTELQGKANQALGDFDHLQGVHKEMLAHREHLQHLLHVSNQALEESRGQVQRFTADLAAATQREGELRAMFARLEQQAAEMRGRIDQLEARSRELEQQLRDAQALAGTRLDRINQLDAEIRAMKASRSWRWTKALRSIERFFGQR